ncbi:MAG: hypothetical protein JSC161_000330 [Candidatus Tokpelaia sp. JSC161]|jgi:hypothetical protein|nr:MAG: hypothetical protein JSC161_000330 [Candidatus Tokpelaia sp. JSC161]
MMRFFFIGNMIFISLIATACYQQSNITLSPDSLVEVEGEWLDGDGIISSFHSGLFETRSADTDEKLAEGNYGMDKSSPVIRIETRSLVRGTLSFVKCSLINPSNMLCTLENGRQFTLSKKVR